MSKSETGTSVVLVCVTNKQNKILTHDKFFKIFSQFGKILRILIFERAIIWKTFVEFDNPDSANKARIAMNGIDFGDEGMKMNVYASQLERITFQDNNSGGVDYTILRQKIEEKSQKSVSSASQKQTYSQDPSPLYPGHSKNSQPKLGKKANISQSAQFSYNNFGQQSFNPHQTQSVQLGTYPQNLFSVNHQFQLVQHQMQIQSYIQQQVQKTNHLLFMLQQANAEQQFHLQMQYNPSPFDQNSLVSNVERQTKLVQELQEVQQKTSQYLDQYYHFLNQWNGFQQKQPETMPIMSPMMGQMSGSYQQMDTYNSNHSLGMSPKQRPEIKPSQKIKKTDVAWNNNSQDITGSNIQFIKSYDGDSTSEHQKDIENILNDDDQLLKLTAKDLVKTVDDVNNLNFDGISMKDSIKDEDEDEVIQQEAFFDRSDKSKSKSPSPLMHNRKQDQENDETHNEQQLFSIFQSGEQKNVIDAKQILSKLSVDIKQDDNNKQSVVEMIESKIQQTSDLKSSNSLEQIEFLINKSKQKQNQELMIQIGKPVQFQSPSSPDYSGLTKQEVMQLYEDVTEDMDPAEYVNPLFLKVVRKSKVIYARWFDKKIVTLKMLYNVFSTFGNIDKMIYLKDRSSALIQYQTLEMANMAKESLNDIIFYNQEIKIFYSNYEEIYLKNNYNEKGELNTQEEYFQGTEETNRFSSDQVYSFNPPSDTLQISNLSKESCSIEILAPIFEPYWRFSKYKQIKYNIARFFFHASNKNTCVVKFDSVQVSLEVLANLNGSIINGRPIQITFSKQKL